MTALGDGWLVGAQKVRAGSLFGVARRWCGFRLAWALVGSERGH